jgi:nucleoside 2-deoxyribosyltransferase
MTVTASPETDYCPSALCESDDPRDWLLEDRPLAYIAGYYTANPAQGVGNAAKMFQLLLDAGWLPVVPHTSIVLDMLCPQTPETWYALDRGLLQRCDAIFICEDCLTEQSVGVRDEIAYAARLDIPIFFKVIPAAERYSQ